MVRLLFVHADSDDRAMYAEYLREFDMDVTEVASTDEAAAQAHASGHDVMITGLMVPGAIPATELIRRVRADSPHRPIVVLTAVTTPALHDAAWQAGCDVLLQKPCFPDELLNTIRRLIADRAVAHAGKQ